MKEKDIEEVFVHRLSFLEKTDEEHRKASSSAYFYSAVKFVAISFSLSGGE